MKIQLFFLIVSVCVVSMLSSATLIAQGRFLDNARESLRENIQKLDIRNINKGVESDPQKEYILTDREGPYLIFVTGFFGPAARQEANELVYELRKMYKWDAYVYEKTFERNVSKDFGRTPRTENLRYRNQGIGNEFAVLIGNFPSMEDRQYEKTLAEVRKCQPESLKNKRAPNPFVRAFGLANPMVAPEHQRGVVDDFIASINVKRPYTLLRNPKRYTVQIASFSGLVAMRPDEVRAIEAGRNPRATSTLSGLDAGEQSAEQLCKELRKRNIEAYEFHDRFSSIVTVGGFDHLNDPMIVHLINQYQAKQSGNSVQRVTIVGIQCDAAPKVIEVPRMKR